MRQSSSRVGIYSGTFDPVHSGHITFALQALQSAKLDKVYFLPERRPNAKPGVEHFAHRVAMLRRATMPYTQFEILELTDISFSVERTLPKLTRAFPDSQLVFLFGSDAVADLPAWPKVDRLLRSSELIVGVRSGHNGTQISNEIAAWEQQPRAVTVFDSYAPEVSSREIRDALRRRQTAGGILPSVERYSDHHWLYVSLAQ